jgi:hypothetical protein
MQGNTIYFLLSWLSIILQVAFAAVLPLLTAFYLDYVIEGLPLDEIKRGREFAVWLHGIFIIHGRYLILPIIAVLTAIQGLFFFHMGKIAACAFY